MTIHQGNLRILPIEMYAILNKKDMMTEIWFSYNTRSTTKVEIDYDENCKYFKTQTSIPQLSKRFPMGSNLSDI